jgi:D-alanine-D-alanine ligase
MKNNRVVFLYDQLPENPTEDQLDVIRQMDHINKALKVLGYTSERIPFSIDLKKAMAVLKRIKPLLAFNMVETLEGTGSLLHLAPSLLRFLDIPYTGVPLEPLFITTNKVLTKQLLDLHKIPTSRWYTLDQAGKMPKEETYIVKPIAEDGSLGVHGNCVFKGTDKTFIKGLKKYDPEKYFIEQFIDGREFNLSMLGGKAGPQVMPPAEILFKDYPDDKPKIVDFNAKWIEDSFEYTHTPRTFRYKNEDQQLLKELTEIAMRCWKEFGLKGYVRVDFRVDKKSRPYVLEVNGNPCIAPESGYVAATKRAGLKFPEVVARIIEDALAGKK